jgi:hypothetical protein
VLNQLRPGKVAPVGHPERSPFSAGEWNRPLRILIDDEEIEEDESLKLLRALAARPSVEVYSTRGSTPYVARVERLSASNSDSWAGVRWRGEDFDRRFVNDPAEWRPEAKELGAEAEEEIEALCQRLAVADLWGAEERWDAIVTGGKLLSALRAWGGGAPLKSPELALAEVGLCLRAHGDYVVEKERGGTVSMASSFHVSAAVGLLPSYPAWRAGAMTRWNRGEGAEPYVLIRSAAERLGRTLRALDYVRVRRKHPRLEDSWGELLFFFDTLLLMLDGALDCLARFFHLVLGLPGRRFDASWDKADWLEKLAQGEGRLGPSPGRAGLSDVCTAVAKLRNSIHGAVLSSELHEWDEDAAVTSDFGAGKLLITGKDAKAIEGACERLGLKGLVESRADTEAESAILTDADWFACAISREAFARIEWLLATADLSCLPRAPDEFDLSFELGPPEYRRNAALLAAIPPLSDDFSDALDIEIVRRAFRG